MFLETEAYFDTAPKWRQELRELRRIALSCGLKEDLKWGSPCYSAGGRNICIIGPLNDCCVFSFFKGALLADPQRLLEQPGKNTQSARVIRLTSVAAIAALEPAIKAYVAEAIALEKNGSKVAFKQAAEYPVPQELNDRFAADPAFREAFEALTPGRQKGYLLHFAAAKQSATRCARIEKAAPRILAGKGMNDP